MSAIAMKFERHDDSSRANDRGHLPPNTLRSRGMGISALKPLRKFGDVDNHLASS